MASKWRDQLNQHERNRLAEQKHRHLKACSCRYSEYQQAASNQQYKLESSWYCCLDLLLICGLSWYLICLPQKEHLTCQFSTARPPHDAMSSSRPSNSTSAGIGSNNSTGSGHAVDRSSEFLACARSALQMGQDKRRRLARRQAENGGAVLISASDEDDGSPNLP